TRRFDEQTVRRLVQSLMRVMVRRQALKWPDDIHPSMLGPSANQVTMHRSESGPSAGKQRIRWNAWRAQVGANAVVRRSPQVSIVSACLGISDPVGRQADIEPLLEEF